MADRIGWSKQRLVWKRKRPARIPDPGRGQVADQYCSSSASARIVSISD